MNYNSIKKNIREIGLMFLSAGLLLFYHVALMILRMFLVKMGMSIRTSIYKYSLMD